MTTEENIGFIRDNIDELDSEILVLVAQRLLNCSLLAKEKKKLKQQIFNQDVASKRQSHYNAVIGKEKGEILYKAMHEIAVLIQKES